MRKSAAVLVAALALIIPMKAFGAKGDSRPMDNYLALTDSQSVGETSYWSDNFSLTASLKVWRATLSWDIDVDEEIETTSNMYGPAINFSFLNNFFAGISFYSGSGFDFTADYFGEPTDFETSKSDFDLWGGWSFHPRGAVFIGYKYTYTGLEWEDDLNKYEVAYEFQGPVIGVNGNLPFGESGFILFGTFGIAFLNMQLEDYTGDSTTFDGIGPSLEFGVSYIIPGLQRLSITGGYKYQSYQTTDDTTDEYSDYFTFSGFTFGVNYRF